ncbi:MAG: hypothetical protein H0T42_17775 [Deltaproteobacteria bacterium]|nr:hypothetical protein [Deltaproteobacteria bacterium]
MRTSMLSLAILMLLAATSSANRPWRRPPPIRHAVPTPQGSHADDGPPRIMYWSGKVNQHVDLERMTWETDPDGVSGANLDPLQYCQKWYPNTVEVREHAPVTLATWRERGNVNEHTSRKLSLECLQESIDQLAT